MAGLPVRLDSRNLACGYDVGSLAQWTFALGLALNPVGWRFSSAQVSPWWSCFQNEDDA